MREYVRESAHEAHACPDVEAAPLSFAFEFLCETICDRARLTHATRDSLATFQDGQIELLYPLRAIQCGLHLVDVLDCRAKLGRGLREDADLDGLLQEENSLLGQ